MTCVSFHSCKKITHSSTLTLTHPDCCVFCFFFFPQMVLTAFSRVGMLREAWPPSAWRKTPWGTSTTTCQTSTLYRWRAWGSGRCSSWVGLFPWRVRQRKMLLKSILAQISLIHPPCRASAGQTEDPKHKDTTRVFLLFLFVLVNVCCLFMLYYSLNNVIFVIKLGEVQSF